MPNDTTTDPSVSNKFDPDFVRTNFPPASERAAKDERSDLIREIAGTRNAVVNSFISDGPVARKPFTASTAGKGVRTRDYIGNRMNQSNDEVTQMKKQIATLEENMQALLERLGMSGGSKKAREEQDEIVVMDEYPKPVLLKNSKYLARYPVPKEKKSWQLEYPGYAPILYSAQELFTKPRDTMQQKFNLMEKVKADGGYEKNMLYYPPIWADPELLGMTMNDRDMYFKFNDRAKVPYHPMHGPDKTTEVNRISYLGTYQLDPITGAPLNPSGRTGMVGRGLLGKYGPNHAADPVVTCFSTKSGPKTLKLALISRQDTKEFALPGGMVDPGENELSGTAIREFCEEAIEGDETGALSPQEKKKRRAEIVKRFVQHKQMEEPIISKVVDDPRNTDNAWMETQAFWFHFATEDDLGRKLQAGDDAVGAQWVDLDADFDINCLYADHSEIVIQLFREIGKGKADSKEFSDLVIPNSVQAKL
ncbi:ADP-ribose pyrophosphatase, mitochondrial-like isoform X2 [Symsagittifera roscoffensis]